MDPLSTWLFCYGAPGFGILMGLIPLPGSLRQVREAFACRHWRQVEGIIRTSQTAPEPTASHAKAVMQNALRVPLEYDYEVDGEKYTGRRLFITSFTTTHQPTMAALLAPYPAGAAVVVFCDPADPARSVLRPGAHWPTWMQLGGCFLLIGFGVLWALVAQRVLHS